MLGKVDKGSSIDEASESQILVSPDGGTTWIAVKSDDEGRLVVANQDELLAEVQKLVGFEIPPFDEVDLTYVATGNGEGELGTAVFSLSATPHTTLTLSYNSDDKLINIIKS